MEGLLRFVKWLVAFCFVYSFGHIPLELLNEVYTSFRDLSTYSHREGQIYLWTSHSSMYSYGHISLELPNKVYISFWPSTERGKFDIKHNQGNSKWFKTFSEETDKNGNPDSSLKVRDLNISAITEWWNTFSNQDPKYNVWTQNCATVVLDALGKGNPWFKDFGYVKTPKDVFEITQWYVNNQQVSKDSMYNKYIFLCMFRYFLLIIYKVYKILLFGLISFVCIVIYIFYNSRKVSEKSTTVGPKILHKTQPLPPRSNPGVKKTEDDTEEKPVLGKTWVYDDPSLDEQDDPEKKPVLGKTGTCLDKPNLPTGKEDFKLHVEGFGQDCSYYHFCQKLLFLLFLCILVHCIYGMNFMYD